MTILAELPRQQRATIALHYVEELSVAEIADTLRLSEGAVSFHLSKGLAPDDHRHPHRRPQFSGLDDHARTDAIADSTTTAPPATTVVANVVTSDVDTTLPARRTVDDFSCDHRVGDHGSTDGCGCDAVSGVCGLDRAIERSIDCRDLLQWRNADHRPNVGVI